MPTVFIDGREGTTGLQIHERLRGRPDLELLEIPAEKRKDPAARRELVNAADFLVTCLPDAAAVESIGMIDNPRTRVLDPAPELSDQPAAYLDPTDHFTDAGNVKVARFMAERTFGAPNPPPGQHEARDTH